MESNQSNFRTTILILFTLFIFQIEACLPNQFEYGTTGDCLNCNDYLLGCAKCASSESGGTYEVVCEECDYNYFLVSDNGNTFCTMDCGYDGRSQSQNYLTQKCEECTSCPQSYSCLTGEYLSVSDVELLTGNCQSTSSSLKEIVLYVSNLNSDYTSFADPSLSEGSLSKPFVDIQNAITKAYELAAPYSEASITIYLYKGTHYALWNYNKYLPLAINKLNQAYDVTIKPAYCSEVSSSSICASSDEQVTLINKRGSFLFFNVDRNFNIENIIIDSIDSIIKYFDDPEDCLNTRAQCCKRNEETHEIEKYDSSSSYECSVQYPTQDYCKFLPPKNGLFRFNINSESTLTSPNSLTIQNCEFSNFLYEAYSFIDFTKYGGILKILDSSFKYFERCGAIIANPTYPNEDVMKDYIVPTGAIPSDLAFPSITISLSELSGILTSEPEFNGFICDTYTFASHEYSGCYSIIIEASVFSHNSLHQSSVSEFGKTSLNLGDSIIPHNLGSVLSLNQYEGYLSISSSEFSSNKLKLHPLTDVNTILTTALTETSSVFGPEQILQVYSVISLVDHQFPIFIHSNTFTQNTGTKGPIFITSQISDESSTKQFPIVFAKNSFTENSGYLVSSTVSIQLVNPFFDEELSGSNIRCSNILMTENSFTRNIGIFSRLPTSILSTSCYVNSTHSDNGEEGIITQEFFGFQEGSIQQELIKYNLQIDKDLLKERMLSYDHSSAAAEVTLTLGSESYTWDSTAFNLLKNEYNENFASPSAYLIFLHGISRIIMEDDFYDNGDLFIEAFQQYSPIYQDFSESLKSSYQYPESELTALIEDDSDPAEPLKSVSLIGVVGSGYLLIKDAIFERNWHKEFATDLLNANTNSSQLLTLKAFYGTVELSSIQISDQKGMYKNSLLQTEFSTINFEVTEDDYMRKGFVSPLIESSEDCFLNKIAFTGITLTNNEATSLGKDSNEIRLFFFTPRCLLEETEYKVPLELSYTNFEISSNNFYGGDGYIGLVGESTTLSAVTVTSNDETTASSERPLGTLFISRYLKEVGETININADDVTCQNNYATTCSCFFVQDVLLNSDGQNPLIITNSNFIGNTANTASLLYSKDSTFIYTIENCDSENNSNMIGINISFNSSSLIFLSTYLKINVNNCNFVEKALNYLDVGELGQFFTLATGSGTSRVDLQNTLLSCGDTNPRYLDTSTMGYGKPAISILVGFNVYLNGMTIQNCYFNGRGAALHLLHTFVFQDTGSSLIGERGDRGGAVYIEFGGPTMFSGTSFINNTGVVGGGIASQVGTLMQYGVLYEGNYAEEGAVGAYATNTYFEIHDSTIMNNNAISNSIIYCLGNRIYGINIFENVHFENNVAESAALTIVYSDVKITDSTFINNKAEEINSNIFCSVCSLEVSGSTFENSDQIQTELYEQESKIEGCMISGRIQATITISDCSFTKGAAYSGGALFFEDATLTIDNCNFTDNMAAMEGGAIKALMVQDLSITNSNFTNNMATVGGDDIAVGKSSALLQLENIILKEFYKNSISASLVNLEIKNAYFNTNSERAIEGSAIYGIDCTTFSIADSQFLNLKSQKGGAIYFVNDQQEDSSSDSDAQTLTISNSYFENCNANSGGALYLHLIHSTTISNCQFIGNAATTIDEVDDVSLGGAIYFYCESENCALSLLEGTNFEENKSAEEGGAIYWNMIRPILDDDVSFTNNVAVTYGNDFASFATTLSTLDFTPAEDANITYNLEDGVIQIRNQKSGGELDLPIFVLKDHYAAIIATDDTSTLLFTLEDVTGVDGIRNTLEGTTKAIASEGMFSDITLYPTGKPGSSQVIELTTNGISSEILDVANSVLEIEVYFRQCISGESYSTNGRCIECKTDVEYLIVPPVEPTECNKCPTEKAICLGGNQIGPKEGFWRYSNSTEIFLRCYNRKACIGMDSETKNLQGNCSIGYQGVLCADCIVGYSKAMDFVCSKCQSPALNVFILFLILISVLILVVILLRSSLAIATSKMVSFQAVYFKILSNHLQLLVIIGVFNLNWPQIVSDFFFNISPISNAATQVFSIDCFIDTREEGEGIDESETRVIYKKMILVAFAPLILVAGSFAFWGFMYLRNRKIKYLKEKTIATILILIFLAHSSITKYMFDFLNCITVDDQDRLIVDLEIKCWEGMHLTYSLALVIPYLILWIFVLPALQFYLIYKNKKKIAQKSKKLKMKYGFLYYGFRKSTYYWEFVILVRKILTLMAAIFLKTENIIIQALSILFLTNVFLILNFKVKPFVRSAMNLMEALSLFSINLTVYCGYLFLSSLYEEGVMVSGGTTVVLFLCILISNIVFFILVFQYIMSEVRKKLRMNKEKLFIILFYCCRTKKFNQDRETIIHKEQFQEDKEAIVNQLLDFRQTFKYIRPSNTSIEEIQKMIVKINALKEKFTTIENLPKRGGLYMDENNVQYNGYTNVVPDTSKFEGKSLNMSSFRGKPSINDPNLSMSRRNLKDSKDFSTFFVEADDFAPKPPMNSLEEEENEPQPPQAENGENDEDLPQLDFLERRKNKIASSPKLPKRKKKKTTFKKEHDEEEEEQLDE